MKVTNQPTSSNDYLVAKALNESIRKIILTVLVADVFGLPEEHEIKELNRAYILLADELQKLYDRNPALSAIEPVPIWQHFDVLKTSTWKILNEYLEDENNDTGEAHIARIERLCILAGNDTPTYSPEQKKLIDYAETVTSKYTKMIDEVDAENKAKKENDWYIPKYTLTYKYGLILINDVLKLKKAHDGSTLDNLMLHVIEHPNEISKPKWDSERTISTTLSNAGFTSTLRKLFFPEVSKSRGVLFRPNITHETAKAERIDTTELDLQLKELGAATEPIAPTQE